MSVENLHLAKSSNLAWARYDSERDALQIDFKNKDGAIVSTYEYLPFSANDWQRFKESSVDGKSAGEWFAANVRNAKNQDGSNKYAFVRIK